MPETSRGADVYVDLTGDGVTAFRAADGRLAIRVRFGNIDQARDALRSLNRAWELLERERKTWGSGENAHTSPGGDSGDVQKRETT